MSTLFPVLYSDDKEEDNDVESITDLSKEETDMLKTFNWLKRTNMSQSKKVTQIPFTFFKCF